MHTYMQTHTHTDTRAIHIDSHTHAHTQACSGFHARRTDIVTRAQTQEAMLYIPKGKLVTFRAFWNKGSTSPFEFGGGSNMSVDTGHRELTFQR